jgi:hypothetical protein
MSFAVTYDFRQGRPSPKLAMCIGRFIRENEERWSRHAKTMALLIKGNIFVARALEVIVSFIKMCLPGCSAIVCHCDSIAREFFKACTATSKCGHEFVSIVDVQKEVGLAYADGASYCLASLAPLFPEAAATIESTLHMLPNGDVRVIQSPADDIMMRSPSDKMHTDGDSSGSLSALKIKGSKEELQRLIGAHFHIGEVIADADVESRNRRRERRRENKPFIGWRFVHAVLRAITEFCQTPLAPKKLQ